MPLKSYPVMLKLADVLLSANKISSYHSTSKTRHDYFDLFTIIKQYESYI